jgi:hypothetical protein
LLLVRRGWRWLAQISAARYVIIEPFDSAVDWYQKYGFEEITGSAEPNRRKMLIDLIVEKKAQAIGMETLFSEASHHW